MFSYHSAHRLGTHQESSYSSSLASSAKSSSSNNSLKIRWLEDNLARTLMVCEAMWEILRDEHGYSDEKLQAKIEEIDLRDGVLDGKNKQETNLCKSCGRKSSPRHEACLYCGKPLKKSMFAI